MIERVRRIDSLIEWMWGWKRQPVSKEELLEWEELFGLLGAALGCGGADRWVWRGDSGKDFSVAEVRRLIVEDRDVSNRYVLDWSRWVPRKCQIFIWRAVLNRIPTLEALQNRNITVDSDICRLCSSAKETVDHLFACCSVAAMVWSWVSSWCKVYQFFGFSIKDLVELHNIVALPHAKKEVLQGIIFIGCWRIWKARNELIFENKSVSLEEIIEDIKVLGFMWYYNRPKLKWVSWVD
ncbi:uncharacterized protein LOC143578784 [Bidens hawaiensis]|uniref:uncharacterized protein LOC143578784 n=1 Tax=Bidens hawaiensis TaxID=980011 RepID=UPI00404A01F2